MRNQNKEGKKFYLLIGNEVDLHHFFAFIKIRKNKARNRRVG